MQNLFLGLLLLVCAGIAVGNSFVTPTMNGLASRSSDDHTQGRLMGLISSAGSLARFFGPMIAYYLVNLDASVNQYGKTSFYVSAGILFVAMLLITAISPVRAQAPAQTAVPET